MTRRLILIACMPLLLALACRLSSAGPSTAESAPTAEPTSASPVPAPTSAAATVAPRPSSAPTEVSDLWGSALPEQCPTGSAEPPPLSSDAPGRGVAEVFGGQIREYLNARGADDLAEALAALTWLDGAWQARPQVRVVDVTGNEVPEVLVELTFFEPGQYSEGALFLYRCAGGEYVGGAALVTAGQVLSADDPDGIRAVQDMTLDGVPEIVHSHISIAGSHAYFTRQFRILSWNGEQLVDLIPEDQYGFTAQADSGDGEIRDQDGNGTLELLLSNAVAEAYPDLGPQRPRTDVWAWNGEAFTLARWETTEPVFRIHAIWDADDAVSFGDFDRALALYQDAVFNEQLLGWSAGRLWPDSAYGSAPTPEPDPSERHRLNAYGRYRIMLLHLAQGHEAEARVVYDGLQERYPGGSEAAAYAVLAYEFWEVYSASGDLAQACAAAIAFAEEYPEAVLSKLGRDFYGAGQREYHPEDICPFGGQG